MKRTFSPYDLQFIPKEFDPEEWLCGENIALKADDGSIALFQYEKPGMYQGHYFFKCKGKTAIAIAKQALKVMFNDYPTEMIFGLTPVDNKPACWMSRHLGFTSFGIVHRQTAEELFIMTKADYNG